MNMHVQYRSNKVFVSFAYYSLLFLLPYIRLHFRLVFTLSPAPVAEDTLSPYSRAGTVRLRLKVDGHNMSLRSGAHSPNSPWVAAGSKPDCGVSAHRWVQLHIGPSPQ